MFCLINYKIRCFYPNVLNWNVWLSWMNCDAVKIIDLAPLLYGKRFLISLFQTEHWDLLTISNHFHANRCWIGWGNVCRLKTARLRFLVKFLTPVPYYAY